MIRTLLYVIAFTYFTADANSSEQTCLNSVLTHLNKKNEATLFDLVTNYQTEILKGYELPEDYLNKYYAKRIERYLAKPSYSEIKNPTKLYRGMIITPEELSNILKNGMELNKVKWNAADGGISFSSNINEAGTYIFQSDGSKQKKIGVIFEVGFDQNMKLVDDPILNSTKTIYKKHSDIQANEIKNTYIWGKWGPESLKSVIDKAKSGTIEPHENWTQQFNTFYR